LSWVGLCPRPRAEASDESEVFRDPPRREASDEAGRWAGLLTRLVGSPARKNLARMLIFSLRRGRLAFGLFFVFWAGRVVFHLNLGTPNCGTRQYGSCFFDCLGIYNL
jgi:hypothetical protein